MRGGSRALLSVGPAKIGEIFNASGKVLHSICMVWRARRTPEENPVKIAPAVAISLDTNCEPDIMADVMRVVQQHPSPAYKYVV